MKFCPTNTKNLGFTLIELLVVVSILVIVTAITIPNFNTFIVSQNLKQAQEQVKNGIRDAQNKAISGVDSSSIYTYWVIKFLNNGTTYQLGKTNTALDLSSSSNASTVCSAALTTTDELSPVFAGGATLDLSGGSSPACIFYKMISADVYSSGLVSSKSVCVKIGAASYGIEVNSSGMVKGNITCP